MRRAEPSFGAWLQPHLISMVLALCIPVLAQAPLKLTLKEAENIAVKQNPRVSSARFTAEAAGQVPKEVASVYQPTAFGSIVSAFPGWVLQEGAQSGEMIVIEVLLLSTQRR